MGSDELAAGSRPPSAATEPRPVAVVLERHGAIAVGQRARAADGRGPTPGTVSVPSEGALIAAVDRLELIEVLCRATLDAILVRAARNGRDRSV